MWSDLLILIKQKHDSDSIGNKKPTPTDIKTEVYCNKKSISRAEFYNANSTGLKPSIVFVVNTFEYEGQKIVEFENQRYKVLRTYEPSLDYTELICEKV
ncbi:phage head closure protein [Clostridium cellulovorans]|uniref:Prophage pi2 protein n=1 Tax=Clostridium cellulovorans (strain ATCC 35296 / DSM 3052 / OCM 3 / 743B) TaxID=573061 RepID=D9SQ11_CLOC7|nr:phage head closure protein [Clostridium cellulovorans]ADL52147.1 prophage pi2 protein [Clostridium cellulovorans 743B]